MFDDMPKFRLSSILLTGYCDYTSPRPRRSSMSIPPVVTGCSTTGVSFFLVVFSLVVLLALVSSTFVVFFFFLSFSSSSSSSLSFFG
jgi:hypothetical protein